MYVYVEVVLAVVRWRTFNPSPYGSSTSIYQVDMDQGFVAEVYGTADSTLKRIKYGPAGGG
jgi:hypothetical protein